MKKVVIITGCNGGIGGGTAEKFLQEGYIVVGMGTREKSTLTAEGFVYVKGDVADKAAREQLVEIALQQTGRIDALVNVAGIAPAVRADLLEMSEESYDRVMAVNTKGLLFLTQLVAKQMLRQPLVNDTRGSIVNISSISAYASSVNRGEYCISKAGVSMITKLFAHRLSGDGIWVNEVRPGIIETPMTEKVKEKYDAQIEGGLLPVPRWGKPGDIAAAVYALCAGQLPYMVGQSIDVDGGFHLQRL